MHEWMNTIKNTCEIYTNIESLLADKEHFQYINTNRYNWNWVPITKQHNNRLTKKNKIKTIYSCYYAYISIHKCAFISPYALLRLKY